MGNSDTLEQDSILSSRHENHLNRMVTFSNLYSMLGFCILFFNVDVQLDYYIILKTEFKTTKKAYCNPIRQMNPLDDISDSSKSAFGRPVIMISLISYYLAKLQAQISKKRERRNHQIKNSRSSHKRNIVREGYIWKT